MRSGPRTDGRPTDIETKTTPEQDQATRPEQDPEQAEPDSADDMPGLTNVDEDEFDRPGMSTSRSS